MQRLPGTQALLTALASVGLLLPLAGCHGSRWARNDPAYADKYPRHSDNVLQMGKQAADARHVAGRDGWYAGVAARDEPFAGGVQVGHYAYPPEMKGVVETRYGLAGLAAEGEQGLSGGVDAGVRVQAPSRLTPFIGAGAYVGYVPDPQDVIDATFGNEDSPDPEFVGAAFPEAGVHFWCTPRWRLTASASHYFTTAGGGSDFTLYGVSLARLSIPGYGKKRVRPYRAAGKAVPSDAAAPARPIIARNSAGLDLAGPSTADLTATKPAAEEEETAVKTAVLANPYAGLTVPAATSPPNETPPPTGGQRPVSPQSR
ncbi:MAG: hypothetical protein AAF790_12210 [Planctomycetota bacterium]